MIGLTKEAISPELVLDSLKTGKSGSVVLHVGIVRPSSEGKKVISIEYQANSDEAEAELSQIANEIRAALEIEDIALCRRLGKLDLGGVILVAAVSAPHRKEAFDACQHAVEQMRNMASIKKREIFET